MKTLKHTHTVHKADSRGSADHGWLATHHSFSFADWYNPSRMGFGALRVINDDTIAAGYGFGMHPHRDMEIISIVNTGILSHKDSMGNVGNVSPHEVQVMSAGAGVSHSEHNSSSADLSLFQIWIMTDTLNATPRYDQRSFERKEYGETLLVSPMGCQEGINIHQDAYISRLTLDHGHPLEYILKQSGHGVYFFVVEGEVTIDGEGLNSRDAIGVEYASAITLFTNDKAEVLAIEVPME